MGIIAIVCRTPDNMLSCCCKFSIWCSWAVSLVTIVVPTLQLRILSLRKVKIQGYWLLSLVFNNCLQLTRLCARSYDTETIFIVASGNRTQGLVYVKGQRPPMFLAPQMIFPQETILSIIKVKTRTPNSGSLKLKFMTVLTVPLLHSERTESTRVATAQ